MLNPLNVGWPEIQPVCIFQIRYPAHYLLVRQSLPKCHLQAAWIKMRCPVTWRLTWIQAAWHSDDIFNNFEWHWRTLKIEADKNLADKNLFGGLRVKGSMQLHRCWLRINRKSIFNTLSFHLSWTQHIKQSFWNVGIFVKNLYFKAVKFMHILIEYFQSHLKNYLLKGFNGFW